MKLNTMIWLKCESKGRPADTLLMYDTTHKCILAIGKWMANVYMGSHIDIRVARTEAELSRTPAERRQSRDEDMAQELESLLLGGTPDRSLQCPHGESLNHCQDCVHEHNEATA